MSYTKALIAALRLPHDAARGTPPLTKCAEAADEIERLQRENAELRAEKEQKDVCIANLRRQLSDVPSDLLSERERDVIEAAQALSDALFWLPQVIRQHPMYQGVIEPTAQLESALGLHQMAAKVAETRTARLHGFDSHQWDTDVNGSHEDGTLCLRCHVSNDTADAHKPCNGGGTSE